jgi:uncharacterized repeat protein (TIGR01451 family)
MLLGSEPTRWLLRPLAHVVVFTLLSALAAVAGGETLTLTKNGPKAAREGDLIEYRLTIANQGTTDVAGVEVLDRLPDAVEFIQAASTPIGAFDPATGIWTLPRLGTGADDSAATLRLEALVRSNLLADPNGTVAAINRASVVAPSSPDPIAAQLTTQILCAFCIDWEILSVGINTEHRSRLPDLRETRFFLDVEVANNGPVSSEGTLSATRFDVSGGDFRPSLVLEPATPVPVSLAAGETQTVTFNTNWAQGPLSTFTIFWEFEVSDLSLLDPVLPNTSAGSWTGDASDVDDDTRCFIAVAASGSYLGPHLRSVRRFRDETLMPNRGGRMLVAWYYALSPAVAKHIADNETRRALARLVLTPVVFAIGAPLPASAAFGGTLLLIFVLRRRLRLLGAPERASQ